MDRDKEILNLAKEIIDDSELKRGSVEALVFKASRLASLVNNENVKTWLAYEKFGYNDKEPSLSYMSLTGRSPGFWGSISTQENAIEASLAELDVVKNFTPSGTYATIQFGNQVQQIKKISASISNYKRICSIVSSNIQDFAAQVYYTYKFGQKANTILEEYRKSTLDKILQQFPDLGQSFETIENNFVISNPRGWTAAALEIRNIFIYLSGKLYTSNKSSYKCRDGDTIKIENEKNKLIVYVDIKMGATNEGKSRAKKLFGIIHEIFTLGGKSKRKINKNELSTMIIDTYVFLNDLVNHTDLKPTDKFTS